MKVQKSIKNTLMALPLFTCFIAMQASAVGFNPRLGYQDSYAVDGVCYCNSSNFDHDLDQMSADTPIGSLNVVQICDDIEAALGSGRTSGRIPYNDIQCGNGPANTAIDETGCPGRVDIGPSGCFQIGPKWDLASVYGEFPNDTPSNALSRTNWEINTSENESDAYLAVDNRLGTRWTTRTRQANGQSFDIDLQSVQAFDTIVLETAASPQDYPRGYSVFISNNGSDWSTAINTGNGSNSATTTVDLGTVNARFLRIVQTGSADRNWWSIHEINLFNNGSAPTAAPTTPAVPTTPTVPTTGELDNADWSITASNNGSAVSQMIDGSASTRWSTRQRQRDGQSITIDLNELSTFNSIVLDSAQSNLDHPRGYEVSVSNDGINFGNAIDSGAGSTDGNTVINFSDVSARYIKIEQTGIDGSHWWSIHELSIFNN